MNFYLRLLICSFVGFALQILLRIAVVSDRALRKRVLGAIYSSWLEFGEALDRSSSGGHAMQGGAIFGLILGVLFYSLLIGLAGAVIWNFKKLSLVNNPSCQL
jgi:hypothetical protein